MLTAFTVTVEPQKQRAFQCTNNKKEEEEVKEDQDGIIIAIGERSGI